MFNPKKEKEINLVLDIGNAEVSAALVVIDKNNLKKINKPTIIFSCKNNFGLKEELDFHKMFSLMQEALALTIGDVFKNTQILPTEIHCFLASPWCVSQTHLIKLNKNSPFIFTEKIANDLIKTECQIIQNEKKEDKLSKGEDFLNNLEIIDRQNIGIKLNGYKTNTPFGKKAQEVEISFLVTFGQPEIIHSIENIIWNFYSFKKINFHSFTLPFFATARDFIGGIEDFILMDISGEVTEVSFVKNDVLEQTITFPLGKNFLIRELAKKTNKNTLECASILKLYLEGKINNKNNLEILIGESLKQWSQFLREVLFKLGKTIFLPETFVVISDNDISALYAKTIKREEFNYSLLKNFFNVIIINNASLNSFVNFKEEIKKNHFLILETIFINKIKNN